MNNKLAKICWLNFIRPPGGGELDCSTQQCSRRSFVYRSVSLNLELSSSYFQKENLNFEQRTSRSLLPLQQPSQQFHESEKIVSAQKSRESQTPCLTKNQPDGFG